MSLSGNTAKINELLSKINALPEAGGGGGGAAIATGEYVSTNTDFKTNPISITGIGFRPIFVLFRTEINIMTSASSPYYVNQIMWHEGLDASLYTNVALMSGKTYVVSIEKSGISVNDDGFSITSPRSDYALVTLDTKVQYTYIAIG